jgi:Zn(2)-Cys(6) binuclear cluster domain-containing protein
MIRKKENELVSCISLRSQNLTTQAFTNRTKTGCITCRRRKKKCDEGKPHCENLPLMGGGFFFLIWLGNNCVRGGFPCAGYTQPRDMGDNRSGPLSKGLPVPIQSRGDMWPPTRYVISSSNDQNKHHANTVKDVSWLRTTSNPWSPR